MDIQDILSIYGILSWSKATTEEDGDLFTKMCDGYEDIRSKENQTSLNVPKMKKHGVVVQ